MAFPAADRGRKENAIAHGKVFYATPYLDNLAHRFVADAVSRPSQVHVVWMEIAAANRARSRLDDGAVFVNEFRVRDAFTADLSGAATDQCFHPIAPASFPCP